MRSILRIFFRWTPIIGALGIALVLGGCSAVRLGYNSAPTLTYWWLDSYFDFDDAQSVKVRNDLQAVQDWHRKQELPLLVQKLKDLQAMVPKTVTAEQVCTVVTDLQTRLQVTLERVAPTIAAIAPSLQDAQLEHMAHEFERRDRTWREEWIDGTPAERRQRRIKQIVDRAESFYGTLEPAQLAVVREHINRSSFDGPRQLREMQRRHQDALQVLRELRNAKPGASQANAQIRALLERSLAAPDPAYRRYMDNLTTESCAAMAALHNGSSAEQRARLIQTLQGYEEDARALSRQGPSSDAPAQPTPSPM
ncbi:MAG: hypothetical protein HYX43_13180 [Burkholderiales bacterium]|nr:hypothetical protein [Burkholderiales bacterium]